MNNYKKRMYASYFKIVFSEECYVNAIAKGQITSEQNCGALNFPKKQ